MSEPVSSAPASKTVEELPPGVSSQPAVCPSTHKQKCSGRQGPVLLLALLALAVGAASPWWGPLARPAEPAAELGETPALTDMSRRLDELAARPQPDLTGVQTRLQELEQKAAAASSGAVVPTSELLSRLTMLEQARTEASTLQQEVATLRGELAGVREQLGQGETRTQARSALLVAALQLTLALDQGLAFAGPWQSLLGAAASGDPVLGTRLNDQAPTLVPWLDQGIPTLDRLRSDYPAAARAALVAAIPGGDHWWEKSWQRLSTLVTIRRTAGVVEADDVALDAVLARAQAALEQEQLALAVEELEKLHGAAADMMKDWLTRARARLAAQALSVQLAEHVVTYLGSASPAAGTAKTEAAQP